VFFYRFLTKTPLPQPHVRSGRHYGNLLPNSPIAASILRKAGFISHLPEHRADCTMCIGLMTSVDSSLDVVRVPEVGDGVWFGKPTVSGNNFLSMSIALLNVPSGSPVEKNAGNY
jgi:hypothetical protein